MRTMLCPLAAVFFAGCLGAQEPLSERERALLDRIEKLERRVALLEATREACSAVPAAAPQARAGEALPEGVTVNVNVDGYYEYNFNRPFDRINRLRAYDVSDNGFSLNQADVILERAADLARQRRFGARLDLMFGQATEATQGSPANEPRPAVFRHVFQAYGTYIAPLGKGLATDFGKFASSIGIEGNYTKDQLNYSRSYWFEFLPFYHMGFRASYPLSDRLNVNYWLVNGVNQTEDFNGFKSQAVLLNFRPASKVSANLNYFRGREQREVSGRTPRGRSHYVDGYMTWQPARLLTLAAEGDYAISRMEESSPPQRVTGGAGYARYRFHPKFNLAGRFEYLDDSGGLFSGVTQTLKEATVTAVFDVASGFQMRWEYRRDWSDVAFFPTADPGRRKREQNTALLGLIWWFGGKQGAW